MAEFSYLYPRMEWIQIKNSLDLYRFRPEDIVYVGADGNYSDLVLYDGRRYKLTMQLHVFVDIFATLRRNPFVRVGKSVLLNVDYIEHISLTTKTVELHGRDFKDVVRLRISDKAAKELKTLLEEGNV